MWVLLTVKNGTIVPSEYAKAARKAGLDIITWTTERSGRLVEDVLQGGNCCNNTLHGGGGEPDRTLRVRRRGMSSVVSASRSVSSRMAGCRDASADV